MKNSDVSIAHGGITHRMGEPCDECARIAIEFPMDFLKESNGIEGVYDYESLQQALNAWQYLLEQEDFHAGVILKAHKILMLHQPLQPNEKGYWRRINVMVGGDVKVGWENVPNSIGRWVEKVRKAMKLDLEPEGWDIIFKKLHVEYENIHPFVDGNGRTGRLFLNWMRVKKDLPILVIKEAEKHEYYNWFRKEGSDRDVL